MTTSQLKMQRPYKVSSTDIETADYYIPVIGALPEPENTEWEKENTYLTKQNPVYCLLELEIRQAEINKVQ